MKRCCLSFLSLLIFSHYLLAQDVRRGEYPGESAIRLTTGWMLQSSAKVVEGGELLSTVQYRPKEWYPATVPTTVVAALVRNKVYPDPTYGMNVRLIPGTTYRIGTNFSNVAMPSDSPFAVPWWYRKEFLLPRDYAGKTIWLRFGGINFRADLWMNGRQVGSHDDVAGAWRTYEFDVSSIAQPGKTNVLAVRIFAPTENDLAITFVDWNPAPPDKNMGLWRGVEISSSGSVSVRNPILISKLNSPQNTTARLTVAAILRNAGNRVVKGVLRGRLDKIKFEQEVELGPDESKEVTFEPGRFPQLNVGNPRLWWPAQMGIPALSDLTIEFLMDGKVSDRAEAKVGIREITSDLTADKKRVFMINGKRILIRGAGWASDMMLRENPQKLESELRYVLDMGLNTVRLEGKLETEEFFEMADRHGILIMAGWCCCDHWERWPKWQPQDFKIAEASLRSQMLRLRHHPSILMWLNGSDNPPIAEVESMYLNVEQECRWPNPILSSATGKPSTVTGASGMKMTGPYEYVAPAYWLLDAKNGGAHGFNTETSPGPAVPPVESLREMLPKEHLWPMDDWWNFHAGGGQFRDIRVFTEALNARYGTAGDLEDFAFKSQLMTYEGIRAMFEAYSRNKYVATGVIQWMLNNAWPSLIWHLYDYYLRPGGGYFGAKKALEPLHPLYSYDDRSIWVVSSQYQDAKGLKLRAMIYNLDMKEMYSRQITLDAEADSTQRAMDLPEIPGLDSVYFLVLRLESPRGDLVGSNFYWLSSKPETLAWDKSTWYVTPTASYADYTGLRQLPQVSLKTTLRTERIGSDAVTYVTVENTGSSLAFFIRLKLNRGEGGPEVLPVLWQDNYFSLLPGERRQISAVCKITDLGTVRPFVVAKGWNTADK